MTSDALPGAAADTAATASAATNASASGSEMCLTNICWLLSNCSPVSAAGGAGASGLARAPRAGFPQLPALQRAIFGARAKPNAGVDCDAAARKRQDRIEIELRHLWQVESESREPVHEHDERIRVGRSGAPEAAGELPGLCAADELVGVDVRQRGDPELGAADQLCEHAARAEGDERAEHGVLYDSGQQLGAAADHRLNDQRSADALGCSADLLIALEVERAAATLGLVCAGRGGLEDDRTPESVCGGDRVVRVDRDLLGHE